jgi:hypothetical protein
MRKGPEKFKLLDILQNTWPKFLKKQKKNQCNESKKQKQKQKSQNRTYLE